MPVIRLYAGIANGIAKFSVKIPNRTRLLLVKLSVAVLLCSGTIKYCNKVIRELVHYSDWVYLLSMLALVFIVIAGIDERVDDKRIRFGKAFWLGWIVCFFSMLIMTFVNPVKKPYFLWSVTGLAVFPLIFIVWCKNNKFKWICQTVSEVAFVGSYLFILANFILVPFFSRGDIGDTVSSYIGLAVNPNNNGMLVIAFFGASLYLLLNSRKLKPPYYLLTMGVCVAISVIADCRTAELGIALQTIGGLIYYYINASRSGERLPGLGRIVIALIAVAMIALASGLVLDRLDNIDLDVHADDESVSEETVSENLYNKLNQMSSNRLTITRYYISQTTFWGHGSPDGPLMEGYAPSKWSFNNAVDILYISGVIPFIGCLIWLVAAIVFVLKCLVGKSCGRPEYLFTIITFAGYFTEFVLEVTIYPMTTYLVFMAYIGFIPIACREITNREGESTDE